MGASTCGETDNTCLDNQCKNDKDCISCGAGGVSICPSFINGS